MPLSLSVRKPNHVTILDCAGRIVAGEEATSLESEVRKWMDNHCDVVLNLAGIEFIDSSGLGLLVRLATSTRYERVAVRFCSAAPAVQKVIALTMLDRVLQPYETEQKAIESLNHRRGSPTSGSIIESSILCADDSSDLLAYLREGLGQVGYHVYTASIVPDALMLLKATRPCLVVAGPRFAEKLTMRATEMKIPVLKLQDDFRMADAGDAMGHLVSQMKAVLK